MSRTNKDTTVTYRTSQDICEKIEAISKVADISKTKVIEALVRTAYTMSIGDIERLSDESEFLVHFEASKKLAEKLKIKVDFS